MEGEASLGWRSRTAGLLFGGKGAAGAKQGVGETRGLKIEEGRRVAEGGLERRLF